MSQCAPPGEDSNPTSSIAQKGQNTQPTTQPLPAPAPAPANLQTPYGNTGLQTNAKTTGNVDLNCLENTSEDNMDDLSFRLQQLQDFTTIVPAPTCQNTSLKVNIIQNQTDYKLSANPVLAFNPAWGYGKAVENPTSICTTYIWILELWMVRERLGQKTMLTQIWGKDLSMISQYQNIDLQHGDDIVVYAVPKTHVALYTCQNPQGAPDNALSHIDKSSDTDLLNLTTGYYKIYSLKLNFQ